MSERTIDMLKPIPPHNARHFRAVSLAGAVMGELGDLVEDRQSAYERLIALFTREGVEVITDFHREQAGLPRRDENGFTVYEMQALEAARLRVLTSPAAPLIVDPSVLDDVELRPGGFVLYGTKSIDPGLAEALRRTQFDADSLREEADEA